MLQPPNHQPPNHKSSENCDQSAQLQLQLQLKLSWKLCLALLSNSPTTHQPNHPSIHPNAKVVKTVTNLVHLLNLYNQIISNFNC